MKLPNMYYPPNTLGWYMNSPIFNPIDLGSFSTKHLASCMKGFVNSSGTGTHEFTKGTPVPETCALTFYGMNHGMAEISARFSKEEQLPEEMNAFCMKYVRWTTQESIRAYYYLVLICVREFRHGGQGGSKLSKWPGMPEFYSDVKQSAQGALLQNPPDTPVKDMLEAIEYGFTNLGFSGGFGGKPWAQITNCAKRFASGETSAEVMMDTIWTLSHNNGPIFNKGMLYSMYHKPSIMKILDVQRSGQIPQLCVSEMGDYVTADLKKDMKWVIDTFGLTDTVDYEMVEKLGALGSYKPKSKPKPKAPEPPKVMDFAKGKAKPIGMYPVDTNSTATIVQYERASS